MLKRRDRNKHTTCYYLYQKKAHLNQLHESELSVFNAGPVALPSKTVDEQEEKKENSPPLKKFKAPVAIKKIKLSEIEHVNEDVNESSPSDFKQSPAPRKSVLKKAPFTIKKSARIEEPSFELDRNPFLMAS